MSQEVEVKPEESSVLQYVKAAASSSDRARAVMIVMITTSVLTFVAIWNSDGWIDRRIEIRTAALRYFDPTFDAQRAGLSAEDKDLYKRAKKFLDLNSYRPGDARHAALLEDDLKELRKIRSEDIRTIHVPFFGFAFDMNDMGMFAGFTFMVVLLWFRFSLVREVRNFGLAFKEGTKKRQLKLCYDLLAMQQVLTVPPMPGQDRRRLWALIPKALFLIPVAVETYQFITDWRSSDIGGAVLSPQANAILLWTSGILLFVNLILTFLCLRLAHKFDQTWAEAAQGVYPEEIPKKRVPGKLNASTA